MEIGGKKTHREVPHNGVFRIADASLIWQLLHDWRLAKLSEWLTGAAPETFQDIVGEGRIIAVEMMPALGFNHLGLVGFGKKRAEAVAVVTTVETLDHRRID